MKKNYVVIGADEGVTNAQVKKMIDQICREQETSVYKFDWEENNWSEIINTLITATMFNEHNIVVINHFDNLTTNKSKSKINPNYKGLLKYLSNPNPNSTLILTNTGAIKVLKNKNVHAILDDTEHFILESWDPGLFKKWILQYCEFAGQSIATQAADLIIERLPLNLIVIRNEVQKLLLLQEPITVDIVSENTPVYFNANVFELANDLICSRATAFLDKFNYLIELGFEWSGLLGALSSNLAQVRSLKVAASRHMGLRQAANQLHMHEYRVKVLWKFVHKFSFVHIQRLIRAISEMDYKYKTNKIYDKILINWYILKLLFKDPNE